MAIFRIKYGLDAIIPTVLFGGKNLILKNLQQFFYNIQKITVSECCLNFMRIAKLNWNSNEDENWNVIEIGCKIFSEL